MSSLYLDRYAWPNPVFHLKEIDLHPGIIVVIPAYHEPMLQQAVESIQRCVAPSRDVLIMVIINEPENVSKQIHEVNKQSFETIKKLSGPFPVLSQHLSLSSKKAGVGLARKIGMDEAIRIFHHLGNAGIITCFDADCVCDDNFLIEIEKQFDHKDTNTALTFFEHPMDGEHPEAIVNYELYLRYYVNALRWADFPYAFQTLGSCISVRSGAYEQQGGMNTRKAGEDFYFIHKMTAVGGIYEINNTTIYPSDRFSDRVPFGTGHAIGKYLEMGNPEYLVYAPETFKDIKNLFNLLPGIFESLDIIDALSPAITSFLEINDFKQNIAEILSQTKGYPSFVKRFFTWMDGLKVLKLVHHCRDYYYPNIPLESVLSWLNANYFEDELIFQSKEEALRAIRAYDRNHPFHTK